MKTLLGRSLKKAKSILRVLIFISTLTTTVFAQNDTILSNIWENLPNINPIPQEKVYLHFDKPYYAAGDKMWFRAYLVNAETHNPDYSSCAIYVELINNNDSLILRQKIRNKDGVYDGAIPISETTPEGTYTIRAYTNWMRNIGNEYFYSRQFYIGNSISSEINSSISYDFIAKDKIIADIYFEYKESPLTEKKIKYFIHLDESRNKNKFLITNKKGHIYIEYNPQKIKLKKPYIYVNYEEELSKYERRFILPAKSDFDVQFFPEGGGLIAGESNCIAFKAIQSNGFSTEIKGIVYDNEKNKVCDFKSSHLGMGKFYLLPDSSRNYYAIIQNDDYDNKIIPLPKTDKNAVLLTANFINKKIYLGIKSDIQNDNVDTLRLIGHSRGTIFLDKTITNIKNVFSFHPSSLRPGIISFILLDKNNQPLSERLMFINPNNRGILNFNTNKNDYQTREKVNCSIKITDTNGFPIKGDFSIAITDANLIKLDSTSENIINTLLLSSDLKGYIEKPNLYFDPNFNDADKALDILMITQGWKRFNVGEILQKKRVDNKHFLEIGQAISGTIKTGLLNKLKKDIDVYLFGNKINCFIATKTDENGKFTFKNLFFPDSTEFIIYADKNYGLKNAIEIVIDKDTFPTIEETQIKPNNPVAINDEYLESSGLKFIYENGVRNFLLEDAVVIGEKEEDDMIIDDDGLIFINTPDYILTGDALERYCDKHISLLVRNLPGMQGWNEDLPGINDDASIYLDSEEEFANSPQFISDGNLYSYKEIQGVNINYLRSVEVLKTNLVGIQSETKYNKIIIVLNFKNNYSIYSKAPSPYLKSIIPIGYTKDVSFYQPKYEVEAVKNKSTPDWRSTIAWYPSITTNDKGISSFSFYTSDRNPDYNIDIEGIAKNGIPYKMVVKKTFSK